MIGVESLVLKWLPFTSTLGTRIDIAEMMDGLMAGADRDLKVWERKMHTFDKVMLKTRAF